MKRILSISGKAEVSDDKSTKHDVVKGDRLIFLHDSSKEMSANEKIVLPDQQMEILKATKTDEEKEFKPFMPYYDLTDIGKASSLYPVIAKKEASAVTAFTEEKRVEEKSWRDNLKRLNEKLKENNKRP